MTCHGRHTESRFSIIVLKEHTQLAGGVAEPGYQLGLFYSTHKASMHSVFKKLNSEKIIGSRRGWTGRTGKLEMDQSSWFWNIPYGGPLTPIPGFRKKSV